MLNRIKELFCVGSQIGIGKELPPGEPIQTPRPQESLWNLFLKGMAISSIDSLNSPRDYRIIAQELAQFLKPDHDSSE